nr:MAG TPA: Internalin K rich repeat protein [Caudoviricetes sp.]
MGKCLITKMKGSVSGADLPVLGKIRIKLLGKTNDYHSNSQGYIQVKNSNIEWAGDENVVELGDGVRTIYFQQPKSGIVYCSDKKNVSEIITTWMYAADVKFEDLNKYCRNLTSAALSNSGQTGDLSEIADLRLTGLSLSHSKVTGDITSLPNRYLLNYLDISNNKTISVNTQDFSICTGLTDLNLTDSMATGDIANLSTLTNLETLSVKSTSVSGDLSSLAGLSKLYYFTNWNLQNTWSSQDLRPSSSKIISGEFRFATATDTDNFLINMAKCQASDRKQIYFQQSHRTSASDAAVSTLQGKGYTLSQLITD